MVSKRVRLDPNTSSKSKSMTADPAPRLAVFGQPLLLEGEDPAAYDQLLARIYAAVNPVDIIYEIFVADVVFSTWEVLRLGRSKWGLVRAHGLVALEEFLGPKLDYDLYSEDLAHEVADILQDNLPEDQAEDAQTLARGIAQNEADAFDKVQKILGGIGLNIKRVRDEVRDNKAKELVQQYVRREPDALTLVNELLTRAGKSIDNFMAEALAEKLDDIERIDHLITIAVNRRNASLREIDRRRAVLGEALRRSVQEVEEAEFKVIEGTPAKGKNAA